MNNIIRADLYRYGRLEGVTGFLKGLTKPGFKYMFLVRRISKLNKYSVFGLLYRILWKVYMYKYGFQILPGTIIGEGFFISHFGVIVINPAAIIGKNCSIHHGVTIGQTNRGRLKGCPTLGDKVWIGTGAVIVGKINIGSNVMIAPNSFVNFDVPDHSIVIGNPGKIIKKQNPTKDYINFVLSDLSDDQTTDYEIN